MTRKKSRGKKLPIKPAGKPAVPVEAVVPAARRGWFSNEWVILGGVLVIGLVLRLWYLAEIVDAPDFTAPQQDPWVQDYYARALVTGDWTLPEGMNDPKMDSTPFFRPPGHAYFLAPIYFFTNGSYFAPRIANIALSLGGAVLLFLLGKSLYGTGVGLIAAFFSSVYWVFIFWGGELNDPIMFVFLVPWLMCVLLWWARKMTAVRAGLAGLTIGCYALMRPNILAFGPVLALWMLWLVYRKEQTGFVRALRRVAPSWAALLLVTMLAILPVTIRNYRVSGEFVPISTYFGENFLIGNGPDSDGVTPWLPYLQELEGTGHWSVWDYDNVVAGLGKEVGRPVTHSEASSIFFRKTLDFIRDHKLRTLRLMLKKAVLFWTPIEITCNKVVYYEKKWHPPLKYLPGFAVVTALFIFGTALLLLDLKARRVPGTAGDGAGRTLTGAMSLLIFVFIAEYYATFLPFFVNGRARVPIIPLCLLVGAYGVHRVWQFAVARDYRKTGVCVLSFTALWGLASIEYIDFEPDHARWHYQRADSYLRIGEVDKAVEEADHILEMPSTASYMNMRLARKFAGHGRKEKAFEHFMAALRHYPDDPDVRFSGAYELIKIGKTEEGIAHYFETLKLNPNDARAHNNLGILFSEQGKHEEALKHFREAIRIDPDFVLAHNNLGNLLGRLGRYVEAVEHFAQAVKQNPDVQDYHYNLAVQLANAGRTDEAIERYRKALQLTPDDARAHNNLGLLLADRREYEKAERHYREALRAVPDFALVYANWGNMLADQGKLEEGIAMYEKGLDLHPDDAGVHNGAGFLYAKAQNVEKALHHYEEALRIAPDFPLAHNNLGNLLADQGKIDEAIEHYERAVQIDPRDQHGYFNLGYLAMNQGRLDDAVAYFLKAQENDPQNADIPNNLANVFVRKVRFDEAIRYYERALEINPRYTNAHFNLGQVLKGLDRLDEAIEHFSKAVELDPNYAAAREELDDALAAKKKIREATGL